MSTERGQRNHTLDLPIRQPNRFFSAATHEEARARLEFLVESGQRCGIFIGPSGTGKSALLRQLVDESASAPFTTILVNLAELGPVDALQQITRRLGVTSYSQGNLADLWCEATDALAGEGHAKRRVLVVFDHLDSASTECQQVVRRLLAHSSGSCSATFVLAFSGRSYPLLTKEWRQMADLRIVLAPLTQSETTEFVESWLRALDFPQDMFDKSATETLHRMSGGITRDLIRLCELALISALHGENPQVSGDVVEAARRELSLLRSSA